MDHKALPSELGLEIFCALDSLSDILSLSATSHWLRGIWIEHTDLIYRQVAPRSIRGEKHARALQFAISGNTKITPNGALSIKHRANFVGSIMNQFNDQVAKNRRANNFGSFYPPDGICPRKLTKTERRRFIRTYYQLWNLIQIDEQQWQPTAASLSMKQVYLLREMCWIPLPIGEDLPGPQMKQFFPDFMFYEYEGRRGKLGSALQETINDHAKKKDSWWINDCPWLVRKETKNEGYAGFHLLWDHGKDALKQYCLGRPRLHQVSLSEEEMEYERQHLWAETSDEEDGI
ncbi:hypothetical protein K505DRAFT_373551 [Melanomma pulvis-pyrius CBS 109.77]|uniref:F-box domain-containing protein n=1 Tax=Melanomma pulvis-pyrius CBS 109.77 TaxID=1314802 RepID=A0A6A6XHG2_9PLEO|nr:hypothetical protein K505DRAFT_373551 [Melanomma pulvis-pyrius CBS 109.77]